MPLLFAATLFVSATLLFMVQPMVGKMILPLLGGSPAAWNTCMVFFQGLLLLGYLYAHRLTGRTDRTPARQARLHWGTLGAALGWLLLAALVSPAASPVPIFRSLAPQGEAYPMFGALALLAAAIGLPFLVLSTTSPLLQRWFVDTNHPAGEDPYFLNVASNTGCLLSLLGYPLFIEPSLTLSSQAWLWAGGFVVFCVLVAVCGQAAANPLPPMRGGRPVVVGAAPEVPSGPAPTRGQLFHWVALAFVPSSLMLGVTFHMTTDIASVPLLWVIPLAMYLFTFVIAFSSLAKVWWYRPLLANVSPVFTLLLVFVMTGQSELHGLSTFVILSLHLTAYFFAALMLHSELARERPAPAHLTKFYLAMSVGGVLGGLFNALLAPVAFPLNYEYAIAIAAGCLLVPVLRDPVADVDPPPGPATEAATKNGKRPAKKPAPAPVPPPPPSALRSRLGLLDLLIPLCMVTLAAWLTAVHSYEWFQSATDGLASAVSRGAQFSGLRFGIQGSFLRTLATFALPCVLCFLFIDRPIRFGLSVGAILLVWSFWSSHVGNVRQVERSFFGILKVEESAAEVPPRGTPPVFIYPMPGEPADAEGRPNLVNYREWVGLLKLSHGTTLHGMQGLAGYNLPMRDNVPAMAADPWGALTLTAMAGFYVTDDRRAADSSPDPQMTFVPGRYDFRQEPLTYYHRSGPVGDIFREARRKDPLGHVAMIGLGTGSVACYAQPGQRLTFYEIDPTVIRLVEPNRHFSFLHDARERGAKIDFVLGDARLKLEDNRDALYSLLLVDAFSSDSIPVHLLTKEAMQLYVDRLKDGGLLAVHISNRYIELEPVVARLAEELGLTARVWNDRTESMLPGKTMSTWVLLARKPADLSDAILGEQSDTRFGAVAGGYGYQIFNHHWQKLDLLNGVDAWTDDYSDVLRVMRFKELQWVRRQFGFPTPVTE